MPLSASDSITLAFQHTKVQLFRPFRLGQWTKLAFVGLLAGEMATGGSGGGGGQNVNIPSSSGHGLQFPRIPHIDPALLGTLLICW